MTGLRGLESIPLKRISDWKYLAGRFARIISARNTKNLRKPEAPVENKTNEQVTGC